MTYNAFHRPTGGKKLLFTAYCLLVLSINGTVQFSVEITVGHTAPDSINSAVIFSLFNEINYRK